MPNWKTWPCISVISLTHVLCLHAEGLGAAKQEITSAKHILETAAKTLTMALAIWQHSWLHSTNLPFDTWGLKEDLPFDGAGLFHPSTDVTLQELDKSIKMSCTLVVSVSQQPPRSCATFCQSWSRCSYGLGSRYPNRSWKQHTPYSLSTLLT